MELVLGTVQFGLAYGVAGTGSRVADPEIRTILGLARDAGIRWLDTAPAYGDIEARLADLCGPLDFRFITKLGGTPSDGPMDEDRVTGSLERSQQRLGARLGGVLFHHAGDLDGEAGMRRWTAARQWSASRGIRLGCSGYAAEELAVLQRRLGMDFVQLPGNAWDQQVDQHPIGTPEVHLRSCFLQGLLLMPVEQAVKRLPAAEPALRRWHGWLDQRGLSPVVGALSVVKTFGAVTHCLIGVDSPTQMTEIAQAWHDSTPVKAAELRELDPEIIDPRRWRIA